MLRSVYALVRNNSVDSFVTFVSEASKRRLSFDSLRALRTFDKSLARHERAFGSPEAMSTRVK